MKPSEIISLARRQTGCTEDIVTTDEAFRFLNFVIEDFWADIRASDSWHWFDDLNINVSAWNWEYPMDEDQWEWFDKFPIWKLEKVRYKKKDWKRKDLDIRFIDKIDINDFPNQWEPQICFLTNNAINLVPIPKEDTIMQIWGYDYNNELTSDISISIISDWTKYTYVRAEEWDMLWENHPYAWHIGNSHVYRYTNSLIPNLWDYLYDTYSTSIEYYPIIEIWLADDKEENIWIPKRWHYILVEWLKYRMYGNMWVNFEWARTNSRAFYDSEKNKAIQNIVDRWQESDEPYYPFLNFLNY